MSRECATVTTVKCNACGKTQTISGVRPDEELAKSGWAPDESVFGFTVDLCPTCTADLKDFIKYDQLVKANSIIQDFPSIDLTNFTFEQAKDVQRDADVPSSADPVCCCWAINPADGEMVCQPCAENAHDKCVGPLA